MTRQNGSMPPERKRFVRVLLVIAFAIILFLLLSRLDRVGEMLSFVLSAARPLLVGLVIAYVLNLPMSLYEKYLFKGWKESKSKAKRVLLRPICMLLAYLTAIAILGGLIALVVPKLIESVKQLAQNFTFYINDFQVWLDGFLSTYMGGSGAAQTISNLWEEAAKLLQDTLAGAVPKVVHFTVGLAGGIFDMVLSIMFSGFLLYKKEVLVSQLGRLCRAVLGEKRGRAVVEVGTMANGIFTRFIGGQLTEALILGTLCFLGMTILRMPYALLISAVIAVTALVPIVGPIAGTIPSALILLVIEPMQAIWFVVFIVVLQQFEGNLIYPKVVGNAIGLSGVWVLFSIILGGGLFGVWGMLLGVPAFAVIYRLISRWVRGKEETRRLQLAKEKKEQ